MRQNDIHVGSDYAYLNTIWNDEHPLRTQVLSAPQKGSVQVRIYHPDLGSWTSSIRTRWLVGEWEAEPDLVRFPHYRVQVEAQREHGRKLTWAVIHRHRFEEVLRQRKLVERLSGHGVMRAGRDFAGHGGSNRAFDAAVILNYAELEQLLDELDGNTLTEAKAS